MPITIGSNIASRQATRRLNQASNALLRSFERLGTGLRINRASDDAAGLSIASTLNVNSRVLGRAKLNINDGLALLSVADSLTGSASDIVTRMTELAEQAANGTLSSTQRKSLQKEYRALEEELRRLTKATSFNGINVLGGSYASYKATTVGTIAASGPTSTNADGRFVSTIDGLATSVTVTDTENNITKSFSGGAILTARTLNNGDVYFQDDINLYRFNFATGSTEKITANIQAGDLVTWDVSADGNTIAFFSQTNYTNNAVLNPYGSYSASGPKVWLLDYNSRVIRGANQFSAGTSQIVVSADGSKVAINISNVSLRTLDTTSMNLTSFAVLTGGTSFLTGVDNDGLAYFASTGNHTGQNPGSLQQLFRYDTSSGAIRQMTNFAISMTSANRVLSTDGRFITFSSAANLLGDAPALTRQMYRFDLKNETLERLTNYSTANTYGAISADGTRAYRVSLGEIIQVDLTPDALSLNLETGSGSEGQIGVALSGILAAVRGLSAFEISQSSGASAALYRMKKNLDALGQITGTIGAAMSRLSSAAQVVESQKTEFDAAESRIRDADIAEESASLVRTQIIQRAAAAILSQSNQQPQIALMLLR